MKAVALGLILCSGPGVDKVDIPYIPGVEVHTLALAAPPTRETADILTCWAMGMADRGVDRVALIGSSRGVAPSQLAITQYPGLFNGGYVAISGFGGANWGLANFSPETSVLLQAGGDEDETLLSGMALTNYLLSSNGHDSTFQVYEDESHGFLGDNVYAQEVLFWFLKENLLAN